MRRRRFAAIALSAAISCSVIGCTNKTDTRSPDETDNVTKALNQSGLQHVDVTQDRDKGVVTLAGHADSQADKDRAESIAKSVVGNEVVANQIEVTPPVDASDAKKEQSDLDKAIDKNMDAVLLRNKLKDGVRYDVKNGVVTLKGTVDSEAKRTHIEKLSAGVPNVQQVVNELEVKNRKATTTE